MYEASMVFFAIVILAGALVVALLTISASRSGVRRMDSLAAHLAQLEAKMATTGNQELRAAVDDLAAALDVTRASNRREFGAIWGRLGGKPRPDAITVASAANDDSFEALLALQSTPPVKPT